MDKATIEIVLVLIREILSRITNLETMVSNLPKPECTPVVEEEQRFNIKELCEYLPTKPKKQTVYGWVSAKPAKIPFHKKGELYFIKSEIDAWLDEDGRTSGKDLMSQARAYISNNPTVAGRKEVTKNYGR